MKKLYTIILVIALIFCFSACNEEENFGGNIPENEYIRETDKENQETKNESKPENESGDAPEENDPEDNLPADIANPDYQSLMNFISSKKSYCGVAYIGYVEGPMGDGYGELFEKGGFSEGFSFIYDIPYERFVETNGYELYCIVPAKLDYSVKVVEIHLMNSTEAWGFYEGETIYESETGEPFLLLCNESEIHTNILVTITAPDGTEKLVSPYLSGMDGSLAGINDDGHYAVDFTPYREREINFSGAGFDDILGNWMMEFYPDGKTCYIVNLEFYYNDYGQQGVIFWYGKEFSEIDECFFGTVYEYYERDGSWNGTYVLDMYIDGGTFYDGDPYGLMCSYIFNLDEDGTLRATHSGNYDPLFAGYENESFEFRQPKG